jgi:SPP1 gp7 family putative phage head morphogenesis protein
MADLDWRAEQDQLEALLMPHLHDAALTAAGNALEALVTDAGVGVDWGLVNTAAVRWARQQALGLAQDITDTSRDYVRQELAAWVESGAPLDVLTERLTPMFGPVRAEMIAVTEITRSFQEGSLITWRESGVVNRFEFRTAVDELVCPLCEPFAGKQFELDDAGHSPPIHVRCRCFAIPVVDLGKAVLRLPEMAHAH